MKKVFIGLLLMISISMQAQTKDSLSMPTFDSKTVGIQEVVQVDSMTKKELYQKAKLFFIDNFKSAKDIIQMDDAENGIIIGKGISKFSFWNVMAQAELPMRMTIKIEVKDNRFRYTIYDVTILGNGAEWGAEIYWKTPKMQKTLRKSLGEDLHRIESLLIQSIKNPIQSDSKF